MELTCRVYRKLKLICGNIARTLNPASFNGLSDAAIDILRERRGFRHWWDNLDAEMRLDIHASLHERFLQITGR